MENKPQSKLTPGSFEWHENEVRVCIAVAQELNTKSHEFEKEGTEYKAPLYAVRAVQMMTQANVHALMMQYAKKEKTQQ